MSLNLSDFFGFLFIIISIIYAIIGYYVYDKKKKSASLNKAAVVFGIMLVMCFIMFIITLIIYNK